LRGANHDGDGVGDEAVEAEFDKANDLSHEVSSRGKPSDYKTWISRLWLSVVKEEGCTD
jgi:hypothetical protein